MGRDDALLVALLVWALARRSTRPTRYAENSRLKLLTPIMRAHVARLLSAVLDATGVLLIVGSTRRTIDEQERLYQAGKSRVHGPNAPHVRGIAVDFYVPPGAGPEVARRWHEVARSLGWHTYGPDSWDPGHAEYRGI